MMFFLGDLDKSMLSLWNSGGRIADVSATNIPNGEEQWDTCRPQFLVLYFCDHLFLTKFVPFDLFQEEPVKADSDEDMINVNGELSFTGGVMVRPTSGSMISNEPSDIMREGDLGLGAVGGAQA